MAAAKAREFTEPIGSRASKDTSAPAIAALAP